MRTFLILLIFVFVFGCQKAATKNDSGQPMTASDIKEVTPQEAAPEVAKAYSQFFDVRTKEEYAGGHAARAVNIPLDELDKNFAVIEKTEPVYLICQTGRRSMKAAETLKAAGYQNVMSVKGGTEAWKAAGLPMEDKPPHQVPSPQGTKQ